MCNNKEKRFLLTFLLKSGNEFYANILEYKISKEKKHSDD